jgi:hypothetical protein
MSVTVTQTTTTMLWPDGRLDVPEEIRRQLGIHGGWQCSLEVIDGALVVRPLVDIPDEDLWAYTPEHLAEVREALAEPRDQALRLSAQDLRDVAEGRTSLEDLQSRTNR